LAILAVWCYLLRVVLDVWGFPSPRIARVNRVVWTIGCAALWLHIAAAFHFIHDWSHANAVRETAGQTRELTGWDFGGGVYVNYAFAILWLWDAAFWWRRAADVPQSPARVWAIHAVFAFMMVNATVVFGPAYWRYVGGVYAGLLIGFWIIRRRRADG
jgi:hypothetical protein